MESSARLHDLPAKRQELLKLQVLTLTIRGRHLGHPFIITPFAMTTTPCISIIPPVLEKGENVMKSFFNFIKDQQGS